MSVQRRQIGLVVDVGRQPPSFRGGKVERHAPFKMAAPLRQTALQRVLHPRQSQFMQGALDQLAILAGRRNHTGRIAFVLESGLRTDEALGPHAEQGAKLVDHPARKQLHAVQFAELGAGAHHHLHPRRVCSWARI